MSVSEGQCQPRWYLSENYIISAVKDSELTGVTLTTCLSTCQTTSLIQCQSVDYDYTNQICYLKSTNRNSEGVLTKALNGWDHYDYFCDGKQIIL